MLQRNIVIDPPVAVKPVAVATPRNDPLHAHAARARSGQDDLYGIVVLIRRPRVAPVPQCPPAPIP